MCEEWFGYEGAEHVLDPVMLMDVADYHKIVDGAKTRRAEGKIMTYILDQSVNKKSIVALVKSWTGKDIEDFSVNPHDRRFPVDERVVPPMEEWLSGFADADFVVTDSFHGCVLAILFHKPFIAMGNGQRGMARMRSLLEMFGLDHRLVHGIDPEDDGEFFLSDPDWDAVDAVLETERMKSMRFLEEGLRKS
jgi:polysaccharide pyruvyl transferase WcaK-like protein